MLTNKNCSAANSFLPTATKQITFVVLMCLCCMCVGAVVGIRWTASEVTPVILVKPDIGGFVPENGSSIGNTWSKDEVKPVLLLKPGIAGFEPREGSSIGNSWSKGEAIPVILVEPSQGGFIPLHLLSGDSDTKRDVNPPPPTASGIEGQIEGTGTASVIETQIEGAFQGWSGETIFKFTNGQIWQQSQYAYAYMYAYRPTVMIFKTSSGFKMKVEGMNDAIAVKRLK